MSADMCCLWSDDTDFYWARGPDHLAALWADHNGTTYEDAVGEPMSEAWRPCERDAFTMHYECMEDIPNPLPDGAQVQHLDGVWTVAATIHAWWKISEPGFFASTEW